jgi:hypothetical protein
VRLLVAAILAGRILTILFYVNLSCPCMGIMADLNRKDHTL